MSDEVVLNLFVSSPGDVQRERERVDFVVERLNAENKGRVRIATIRWETQYYSSHETFQAQIPESAQCDLVLAIFGARLGSPLPESFPAMSTGERYPSGTAYEVLSAIDARRHGRGIPDVYVFRRPRAPLVSLDAPDRAEIEAQWQRLSVFFETWFRNRGGEFLAAFQEFATTDEFAVKIEDCLRQWLVRRGFPPKHAMWDRAAKGSPYPGLAAFDEDRQNVFFGRSLVIDQAIRRLREVEAPATEAGRAPFLLMIGASGSGKSSLLRAGLLPRIGLPGVLPEVDLWRPAITSPGLDPFQSLADSLLAPEALGPELSSGPFRAREILARQLAGDPEAAVAPLRGALETAAEARRRDNHFEKARPARLFLAIDQAERLLIETPAELRPRFAALIEALCRHRLATVVMALRSDAYPRFQAIETLVALRDAGATLDLLPATQSELEEMALKPAALCEPPLQFERRNGVSLASTLVADARGGDALPLLQMTLARLNAAEAARGDGVLRFSDYTGLAAAVTQTANEALAGLDAAAREQLPYLITGLVRDFATDPVTLKPTATVGALDRARFESGRPERKALVEAFVDKRLLIAEGDAASERVRPTHESLLRIWPEAVKIVEAASHLIRARAAIEPAARDWVNASADDKARHLEISPALLEGAIAYVDRFGDEVDPTTRSFVAEAAAVAEARRERDRQERERKLADALEIARAHRRVARTTGVGLVAALALAALAGWQWRSAVVAQVEAQTQRDRAERALTAAIKTADSLVFDLAQKFRNLAGAPKSVVKDILEQARQLQEQLINSGETNAKLSTNYAAALGEIAITELALGDTSAALADAQKSRDIYTKILDGKPQDIASIHNLAFSQEMIGDILKRQGQFDASRSAYDAGRTLVEAALARGQTDLRVRQDQSLIVQDIAELQRTRGDMAGALKLYQDGLAMARGLAADQPNEASAAHGLAVAHRNVGDTLLKLGSIDEAAKEFDVAADIARKLAQDHPDNTLLLRDYTLSQERLGETLTAKHNYPEALTAFADGEATAIALIATDPANLEWQYDVSVGHIEVGDTQLALKKGGEAVESFRQSVAIDKMLIAKDPANTLWRVHNYQSLDRLGGALEKRGAAAEALAMNREALAFANQALAREPNDADWLRRAIFSEDRVGGGLLVEGKYDEALVAFQDALAKSSALDPGQSGRELVFANLMRVGGAHAIKGDAGSALTAYAQAEKLVRATLSSDPKSSSARGELASLLVSEASMKSSAGHTADAETELREAIELSAALGAEKPGEPGWPREQATAYDRLGDVLKAAADPAGAIEAYKKSLAILSGLPADLQSDPDLRTSKTMTQEALAASFESQKDYAGAEAAATAAIALRKGLADEAPDDPQKRRWQLIDNNTLGRLYNLSDNSQAALAAYQSGLEIAQSIAGRPDAGPLARNDLVISLFLVGVQVAKSGDAKGAAAYLARALPLVKSLTDQAPTQSQYWRELLLVSNYLGDDILATDDRPAALNAYLTGRDAANKMLALGGSTGASDQLKMMVGKIGGVANSMVFAGDFKGALAAINEAVPTAPDQNWFDLVRAAALMFLDRPDEARAIYAKHRGDTTFGDKRWETATLEGFALLRKKGLVNPLMDEIETSYAAPK